MKKTNTYSICIRLRRTVIEDAFVRVPLTDDIMEPIPEAEGQSHVDPEKVMRAAVRLGSDFSTQWIAEDQPLVEPHPIQKAPPAER